MDRHRNIRKFSPFYRTLSSIEAAALLPNIKKILVNKEKKGKGIPDHLMRLGD